MGELRGAKAEQALDVVGDHPVVGVDRLVFGHNRNPYDGGLRRLQFKVVGEVPNIQMVRMDDNGKATSARPGSPEELLLYKALQDHDKVVGERDEARKCAEEAEDALFKSEFEITNLKTRLVEETARLREKLEGLRAERDHLREQLERANEQLEEINAALNELKPEKGHTNV